MMFMSSDGQSCFEYKSNAAYVLVLVVMSIKFFYNYGYFANGDM